MRPKDSVHVTSEIYTGMAVVEHVHLQDKIAVVRRAADEQSVVRLRRPGALFVVDIAQCRVVTPAAAPARHPVEQHATGPFILGLAGPKKVGKSTTADAVRSAFKRRGLKAEIRSFAGPLYQSLSIITSIHETVLRDQTIKDRPLTAAETTNPCLIGKTIRSLLEWLGEGVRSTIGIDHWIHRAFSSLPDADIIIFDDSRHDAEFETASMNFELARANLKYPGNHPSAMPPDPKWIAQVIKLDDLTPTEAGEAIATYFVDRMYQASKA